MLSFISANWKTRQHNRFVMDTLILPNVMKFCILIMPHIFPFKKKKKEMAESKKVLKQMMKITRNIIRMSGKEKLNNWK